MSKHKPIAADGATWVRVFRRATLEADKTYNHPQLKHLLHGTFVGTVRAGDIQSILPP